MTIRKIMTIAVTGLALILTGCSKNYEWLDREPMVRECMDGGSVTLRAMRQVGYRPTSNGGIDLAENARLQADNVINLDILINSSRMKQMAIMSHIGAYYSFVAINGTSSIDIDDANPKIQRSCEAFVDRFNHMDERAIHTTRFYDVF